MGFETLAVEVRPTLCSYGSLSPLYSDADLGGRLPCTQDKDSMLRLVQVIDQALGYVPPSLSFLPSTSSSPHTHLHSRPSDQHATHHHSAPHPSFSQSQPLSSGLHTSTIQEKWVDHPKEWEEFERSRWEKEGEWAAERANEREKRKAVKEAEGTEGMET